VVHYAVEVTPAASRQIRKLDRNTQKRILARIEKLEEEPRPRDASKLQSPEELYRVRVGDYRIVYRVEDDRLVVLIVRVGNRREVYRNL
jgi:mRNA interferase RelE/StbE